MALRQPDFFLFFTKIVRSIHVIKNEMREKNSKVLAQHGGLRRLSYVEYVA